MECPRCQAPMQAHTLTGHNGRTVTVDLCFPCQSFWFDIYENLALTPASTLDALPRHRRAHRPAEPHRGRTREVPALQRTPAAHHRHAAPHPLPVSALPEPSRPPHHLPRVPQGEAVHPCADPAADRRSAGERADAQLLELRRHRRSREGIRVRALRLAALDARHAAGAGAGRAAAEGRSERPADRPGASPEPGARPPPDRGRLRRTRPRRLLHPGL